MRRAGGQSRKVAREVNVVVCAKLRDTHDVALEKACQSIGLGGQLDLTDAGVGSSRFKIDFWR